MTQAFFTHTQLTFFLKAPVGPTNVLANVCPCPNSPSHGLKSKGPCRTPGLQQYLGGFSTIFGSALARKGPKDVLPKSTSNGWFHGGKWLVSRWKMVHVVNQEIIPKISINGRYMHAQKEGSLLGCPHPTKVYWPSCFVEQPAFGQPTQPICLRQKSMAHSHQYHIKPIITPTIKPIIYLGKL